MSQIEMNIEDPRREPFITEQIECVKRELKMRKRNYAYRVMNGKMKQEDADHEMWLMGGVLNTLLELPKEKRIIPLMGLPD